MLKFVPQTIDQACSTAHLIKKALYDRAVLLTAVDISHILFVTFLKSATGPIELDLGLRCSS